LSTDPTIPAVRAAADRPVGADPGPGAGVSTASLPGNQREAVGHATGPLAHHFDDLEQQKEASTLGMWAFLATEVMFFGGAFLAYSVYRWTYPSAFAAASRQENWLIGAINTAVLLGSSLTVALAVHSAQIGRRRGIIGYFALTILLALVFIGVKVFEYSHLYHQGLFPGQWGPTAHVRANHLVPELDRGARIFFAFYFGATGLHASHMLVGIGLMLWVIWRAYRHQFSHEYYNPVEIVGLYWHFVDIVWIFLYPLLYLVDRTG
jgi:cytochrome c oxidase subunit 3